MYKASYGLGCYLILWVVVLEYPSLSWISLFDPTLGTESLKFLFLGDQTTSMSQIITFNFRSTILGIPLYQTYGVFDLGTIPTFSGALSYTNHIASIFPKVP